MTHPRYYGGSVMYTRNDTSWLYVLGGDTTGGGVATATCLKYNVITDTWEYIAPLPEPLRTNATAILGDKIYTMGGFNAPFPSPAVASFYEYDINANSWTQLPDLPDPMFFAGAEGFEDSLIYIIGGIQDNVITDDLWRHNAVLFNINKMSFREATPMPEGTASFGHSLVGNSLFIQAGLKSTTELWDFTLKGDINVTDRATINWSQGANYPLAVYAQYSYPISDDEIYSGGGSTTTGFNPIVNAYGYKIGTNTYEIEPNLPYSQMAVYGGVNYRSFPNPSGVLRVAISGGITTGPALTNQTWIYTEIIQSINIDGGTVPEEYSLVQNYPNPFNPSTNIEYSIPSESFVELKVYDVLGNEVASLVNEQQKAGVYRVDFTADNLSSGMYFARITANEFTRVVKMTLLR